MRVGFVFPGRKSQLMLVDMRKKGKTGGSHLPTFAFFLRLIGSFSVAYASFFPTNINVQEKIFRPARSLKLTNSIYIRNVKTEVLLISHPRLL